jgi:hypothetical protein
MPDVDFAMSYPCHFLLTASGNPESITSDGHRCICLFTDRDLVESFYRDKYGGDVVSRTIEVFTCDDREALLGTLREWAPPLADQGVFHLAIDVSPGKMVGRVPITEFIDEIARQS